MAAGEGTGFYDAEAPVYDDTRGGTLRARAAADAVAGLAGRRGPLLDVAGGTGIVSAELARLGYSVLVADLSPGMLRLAADRLPGRVAVAAADRLPVRDRAAGVVATVWLLHLLPVPVADRVIAEAARVLDDDGVWVTTADKPQAHGHEGVASDDRQRLAAAAAAHGLVAAGESAFTGPSAFGSATDGDPVFPLLAFRRPGPG